jgi:hypothetical protein
LFWVNSEFTGCESSSTFDEAVKSQNSGWHVESSSCGARISSREEY